MNIKKMAKRAGFETYTKSEEISWQGRGCTKELTAFAELVAAHEREECAKIAEDKNNYYSTDCGIDVATDIADAIRARGKA